MGVQSNVAKSRERQTEVEHHEAKRLGTCPFCGSRLTFSHEIDANTVRVVETAHCIGCGVALAPQAFTIQ